MCFYLALSRQAINFTKIYASSQNTHMFAKLLFEKAKSLKENTLNMHQYGHIRSIISYYLIPCATATRMG